MPSMMGSMLRLFVLVSYAACHAASRPVPANTAPLPPSVEAKDTEAAKPSACSRYQALVTKISACTAISDADRRHVETIDTDMMAKVSESGMDDSSPVDEEALCESAIPYVEKSGRNCLP